VNENKKQVGNRGEELAAQYLMQMGFVILARNYRKRIGEIDLIAEKDGILAFCEVKRSRFEGESHPELRVNAAKQKKLARCAQIYLSEHPLDFESCRFDILAVKTVRGREIIDHIENAFWPPEGWDEE
jgi:putative endonuclease